MQTSRFEGEDGQRLSARGPPDIEELGHHAERQYKQLSATVDTMVIERVRHKVLRLDLKMMREAVQELRIAGVPMDKAMLVVGVTVTTAATAILKLKHTAWVAASGIRCLIACELAGIIVGVIFEAIYGAMERKELERRVPELEQAAKTMHDNRTAIVDCAERLREALIHIQGMSSLEGHRNGFSFW